MREREEDRVPRRDVGRRDVRRVERTVLRDRAVADQRRAAECRKVHVELDVPGHAKIAGHIARRLDLARMDLAVSDRERVELVALGPRHRARGVGVEPAAQQQNRSSAYHSVRRSTSARQHVARGYDPPDLGAPDVLVGLQLQPHREPIREDPLGQLLRRRARRAPARTAPRRSAPTRSCLATTSRAYS